MLHGVGKASVGWHGILFNRAGDPLPVSRVRSRLVAYVYGNVLTLAAVAVLTPEGIHSGHAAWVVFGAGLTTFLAHIFAEFVAHATIATGGTDDDARHELLQDIRDALPILSSASVPTLALILGWLGWLPTVWSLAVAGGVIVLRLASIPIVSARVRGEAVTPQVLIAGLLTALLALAVVVAKIFAH
ncbi:MAG: hypothetical protein QM658_04430 [Gordonia sp. (in: high G+C Gram-positive bacteria)]